MYQANSATGVTCKNINENANKLKNYNADVIIASADYHFIENELITTKLEKL